ncbi:MAG: YdeI/OmpD-associated family protein [Myxococcota bacterium]|nr:YdeI/OmpD-associated family protein [Myxococcota bacterium]
MQPAQDRVQPETLRDWRAWLAENHGRAAGIWLVTWKRSSGKQRYSNDDAIEEALCFGWIDSKPARLDDERTMLWFAPRKAGSGWSRLNKERVEALIASGRMAPPGLAKIEAARQDGSWSKLDAVEALAIPDDLVVAFGRHAGSETNFEAFPRSAKRGILEWIVQAKRPETRARRVEETARLAARNERANQWPKKG